MTQDPTDKARDLEVAQIVNEIQIQYADRLRAGDEVISTYGTEEIIALIDKAEKRARIDTGKHILHDIMPDNEDVESYDRADLIEVFGEIQDYVRKLEWEQLEGDSNE